MRPNILENAVANIIESMDMVSKTKDRQLYDYYRDVYVLTLNHMSRHNLWVTEEQQARIIEINRKLVDQEAKDKAIKQRTAQPYVW